MLSVSFSLMEHTITFWTHTLNGTSKNVLSNLPMNCTEMTRGCAQQLKLMRQAVWRRPPWYPIMNIPALGKHL
jgi:hypothetical protein